MAVVMDRIARHVIRMHQRITDRVEALTYYAKATPGASATTHAVTQAILRRYALRELQPETILQTDQELRIPTVAVTWTPTDYDEFARVDGTRWRILSVADGPGYPFYRLQVRQIG